MARKKKTDEVAKREYVEAAPTDALICDTLYTNYMPYAMSVIISRAIPEIDGFKPAHRKLLYTMYKMGLLKGNRTKSANIVGQTMKLNPHGDSAIYETMVRLTRGNEALMMPFVDSKGNFGKVYSRDMAYAASRYTEAKLDSFCEEVFRDIDSGAVDFVDNYDGQMKEPTLLPTTFPNILVSPNKGIAVGMASDICGFNLEEVCRTTIALIKDKNHDILSTLPAPDFSTGGEILYDPSEMTRIYETGQGSFKVRSKWTYNKKENIIEIYEIPYSTTLEVIIESITDLVKAGKVKEITDIRDESDLSGLKIAMDLKRGVEPEELMTKLFKLTPLQNAIPCNFNILVNGMPRVMGVRTILEEWLVWRTQCTRNRIAHDVEQKKKKLHLLQGLAQILLDIDEAIRIIRNTEKEEDVVPNLMAAFSIDRIQAEYIADIKLRNINKEFIIKRISERDDLEKEIARLEAILKSDAKVRNLIVKDLEEILKKYPTPRRATIVNAAEVTHYSEENAVEDYPVNLFLTNSGYFKKITNQSWKMASDHKLKEGDEILWSTEASNKDEIIFLTNQCQAYKAKLNDIADTKASAMGDFMPQKLGMAEGEVPVFAFIPGDYKKMMLIVFENGKCAKFDISSFETKQNRKKLTNAYSDKVKPVAFFLPEEDDTIVLFSNSNRAMAIQPRMLEAKTTRTTQGVQVMTLKKNGVVTKAAYLMDSGLREVSRYAVKALPAQGALLKEQTLWE